MLPCPWPDCEHGLSKDTFVPYDFAGDKMVYKRESFVASDGGSRYFWLAEDESYGWAIRQTVRNELFRLSKPQEAPIFHYTSLEGFKGIIESQDFWLTESSFLNDSTEIEHGIDLAHEVFKEFSDHKDGPIFEMLEGLGSKDRRLRPRTNIACFSSARDNLSQWRAYSGSGIGVSLGFAQTDFFYKLGFPRECQLVPVLYSDGDKRALWDTFARFFTEAYLKDSVRQISVKQFDNSIRQFFPVEGYASSLYSLLHELAASCKDSAFADEREIRLFYTEHPDVFESFSLRPAHTRFRPANCFLAPYTTLHDIREADGRLRNDFTPRLSLCEVVVGPHPRSDLAIASIKKFLVAHGYGDVPVNSSAAPYR